MENVETKTPAEAPKKKKSFFDDDDEDEVKKDKGPSKFSLWLNRYFHHLDRGGSLKSEVTSGFVTLIIAICSLFMNMQVISQYLITDTTDYGANADIIASVYFACTLLAFIGTLLIGLVARLPLTQASSLSFTTVMISTVGALNGLTYYNLLALSFISAILFTLIVSIPPVKAFLKKSLPTPVKTALMAAVGLLLAFYALQLSGIVSFQKSVLSIYGIGTMSNESNAVVIGYVSTISGFSFSFDKFHPFLESGFIASLVAIVLALVFKGLKLRHPYLWSLLLGQLLFIILGISLSYSTFTGWARIWMIGGDDSYLGHVTSVGLKYFSFGKVFTQGFDFSAYQGNVFVLVVSAVASFLFLSLFDAEGSVAAVNHASEISGESIEKGSSLALICTAGMGIIAPLLGVPNVSISKASIAGSEDKAKSGISSLVVALGLLLSLFAWVVPTLFATGTSYNAQTNMYGHLESGALQTVTEASFGVVDALMILIGLSLVKQSVDIAWKELSDSASWIAVVAVTLFTSNLAYGVLAGLLVYDILKLASIKKNPASGMPLALKDIGLSNAILTGVMSLTLVVVPCFA